MKKDNKTDQVGLRIDPELKLAAMEAAWRDRRSLSSLIAMLLEQYCREQGFLKTKRIREPAE